jgi:hypothetical protein
LAPDRELDADNYQAFASPQLSSYKMKSL